MDVVRFMADYYSLLSRAVSNLPKSSPASARRAIYDRARKALIGQLRSLKPPLPESDIAREENALDVAVKRLEAEGLLEFETHKGAVVTTLDAHDEAAAEYRLAIKGEPLSETVIRDRR